MRRSACWPTRPARHCWARRWRPRPFEALDEVDDLPPAAQTGWFEKLQSIGKPLLLGLSVFAVIGGVGTWALVHLAWTLGVQMKRRQRLRARVRA